MMDEESVGLLGVLLIVTGLLMTHQVQTGQAARLANMHWRDVVDSVSCGPDSQQDCYLALAR